MNLDINNNCGNIYIMRILGVLVGFIGTWVLLGWLNVNVDTGVIYCSPNDDPHLTNTSLYFMRCDSNDGTNVMRFLPIDCTEAYEKNFTIKYTVNGNTIMCPYTDGNAVMGPYTNGNTVAYPYSNDFALYSSHSTDTSYTNYDITHHPQFSDSTKLGEINPMTESQINDYTNGHNYDNIPDPHHPVITNSQHFTARPKDYSVNSVAERSLIRHKIEEGYKQKLSKRMVGYSSKEVLPKKKGTLDKIISGFKSIESRLDKPGDIDGKHRMNNTNIMKDINRSRRISRNHEINHFNKMMNSKR